MKLHTQCVAYQPPFSCMSKKLLSLFDEISMASQHHLAVGLKTAKFFY